MDSNIRTRTSILLNNIKEYMQWYKTVPKSISWDDSDETKTTTVWKKKITFMVMQGLAEGQHVNM